jgi:chromosome segregation ATPase
MANSYHNQEISHIDGEIRQAKVRKESLERELSHLTYDLKELTDEIERSEREETTLKNKFADLKDGSVERGSEERVLDSEKKRIREAKDELETERKSIAVEEARLKKEMQVLANRKEIFARTENQYNVSERSFETKSGALRTLIAKNESVKSSKAVYGSRLRNLQGKITEQQKQIARITNELAGMEREKARIMDYVKIRREAA